MNTKKYLITFALATLLVASFGIFINIARADCTLSYDDAVTAYQNGTITVSMVKTNITHVQTTVFNGTSCALPGEVYSYKVFDNVSFNTQVLIGQNGVTIPANTSHIFTSDLASCLTQVDFSWYGSVDDTAPGGYLIKGHIFGVDNQIFDNIPSAQGVFCTNTPPQPLSIVASCSASPTSVNTGGTINWSSTATGGTGTYTYSWTGTDSLSGSLSTTSKTYSSTGTKNGTITVTSGSDSATANCSATVNTPGTPPTPPNNPSCTSNCGGGGGGGNGGGPIIVLGGSLNGYCVANPATGKVGDPIIWSVYPSGGIGSYTYNWFGTDVYSNFAQSFGKIYSTPGPKTMTVIINSGSESITRNCSLDLGQVLAYTSLSSVYLSEVPYTGIADLNNIWVFTIGLALWSAMLAYYLQRRKGKMATEIISVGMQKQNTVEKTNLISRNEMYENAISEVENYARNGKAIISTEAIKDIVKKCFIHNGKTDVAVSEVISRARHTKNIAESDWIAIGEKDL